MPKTPTKIEGIDPHLAGHYALTSCKEQAVDVQPLKFLKLVYIAHGFHLALWDNPLINVPVEAWKYGPVIRDLYFAVRQFGGEDIPFSLLAGYATQDSEHEHRSHKEVINRVVEVYGKYTGVTLSATTHKPGSPWSIACESGGWGRGKTTGNSVIIDDDIIKKYYKSLLV